MRFIEIDGKRYAWRDIVGLRREQARREREPQPTLPTHHHSKIPVLEFFFILYAVGLVIALFWETLREQNPALLAPAVGVMFTVYLTERS